MENIVEAFKAFINTPTFTAVITIIYSILAYIFGMEKPELFLILFVLLGIDMLTGMMSSRCIGLPITSRRWFHSVVKLVFYLSAIILSNMVVRTHSCLCEDCSTKIVSWIPTAIMLWISSLEIKSVNENFKNMGYKIPAIIEDKINNIFDITKYRK